MIDEYWTWTFYGYHSNEWADGSHKPVVVRCDKCCQYRISPIYAYRDLCMSCAGIGKKKPPFTEEHCKNISISAKKRIRPPCAESTKLKLSIAQKGKKRTPLSDEWRNNISKAHKKLPPRPQEWCDNISKAHVGKHLSEEHKQRVSSGHQGIPFDEWGGFIDHNWRDWSKAIYINNPFAGCCRHHMTKTIVVCIPKKLHEHIHHNIKNGTNMGEINLLALQFINGGL